MKLEINSLPDKQTSSNEISPKSESVSGLLAGETTKNLKEGINAAKNGNRAEARVLLLRVTESDPKNETAWLWLASISEYPEELLVFLQNVLTVNPNNERAIEWSKATKSLLSKTFVQRGVTASQDGNKEFAKQSFLQAIVHDSQNEMAWLWLASVAEHVEEKLSHLNKVLSLNPNNETATSSMKVVKSQVAQVALKKANQLAVIGDRELAAQHLEDVLKYDDKIEEAWLLKAILTDSFDEKATYFNKALSLNPNNLAAKAGLSSIEAILQSAISMPNIVISEVEKNNALDEVELVSDEEVAEAVERAFQDPQTDSNVTITANLSSEIVETIEVENVEIEQVEVETFEMSQVAEVQPVTEVNEIESFNQSESVEQEIVSNEVVEVQTLAPTESVEVQSFEDFANQTEEVETSEVNESEPQEIAVASQNEVSYEDDIHKTQIDSSNHQTDEVSSFESFDSYENTNFQAPITSELSEEVLENAETQFNQTIEETVATQTEAVEMQSEVSEIVETALQTETVETQVEVAEVAVEVQPETQTVVEVQTTVEAEKVAVIETPAEIEKVEVIETQPAEPIVETVQDEFLGTFANDEDVQEFATETVVEQVQVAQVQVPQVVEQVQTEQVQVVEQVSPAKSSVFEEVSKSFSQMQFSSCPFCLSENNNSATVCQMCHSVMHISELDMLFDYQKADRTKLIEAIQSMEADKNSRNFSSEDFVNLGLAYLNIQNLKSGLSNLQKGLVLNPTDASLENQVKKLQQYLENVDKNKPEDNTQESKTILVVDDSPTVRKLVSTKLEKCGHKVVAAIDGMDALAKINEILPDLILLDITMPRLDGYQVCKLIRGNDATKEIPIIMISGKDGFFDKVRGKMAGSSGYITKPFGPDTLMRTLDSHFASVSQN